MPTIDLENRVWPDSLSSRDESAHPSSDTAIREESIPLCVDLDGTLVRTDTLLESLFVLLKKNIWYLFILPIWLLKGKASFKKEVCRRAMPDVSLLPYNERVLDLIRKAHSQGRRVVLATAADSRVAEQVAAHVGLFSEVLASDGLVNLGGSQKRRALEERFGARGFDYVGNSLSDVRVWEQANKSLVVNAPRHVMVRARKVCQVQAIFENRPSKLAMIIRACRAHQWVKNLLLFVPLITSHQITDLTLISRTLYAFVAFSLCASSVYLLNDILDLEADRKHAKKRHRPFADGSLPLSAALPLTLLCLGGSALVSLSLPFPFKLLLILYYVLTLLYSFYFKKKVLLDVHFLGGLYTIRILAGGAATGVICSPWLLAFSCFLFLSLALVKRFAELRALQQQPVTSVNGRSYLVDDLQAIGSLGTGSAFIGVLVLALYINSPQVGILYDSPSILWLLCPLLMYWICRIWLIAYRNKLDCDPVLFTLKDGVSYLVGLVAAIVLIAASLPWFWF